MIESKTEYKIVATCEEDWDRYIVKNCFLMKPFGIKSKDRERGKKTSWHSSVYCQTTLNVPNIVNDLDMDKRKLDWEIIMNVKS